MRPLLLLLVIAIAAAGEDPPAAPPVDPNLDLLKRMVLAQRGITTIQGTLTQTMRRADEEPASGDAHLGRFAVQVPDRYNLVYSKPKDDQWRLRLCCDGERRWRIEQFFADEAPDVVVRLVRPPAAAPGAGGAAPAAPAAKEDEVGEALRRIIDFRRLDLSTIGKDFKPAAEAMPDGTYRLTLVPRQAGLAQHIRVVVATLDQDFHTTGIVLDDPQGNRVTVVITTAVYNQPVAPEVFVGPAAKP